MGSFHKAKNRNFQKGLAHDFCQKFQIFHCLFFWLKKSLKTDFLDVINENETFLDHKNGTFS